ncbi:HAD hydrolase-like protein (plasmid) [Rhizobium sp. T1470]|uniref:HAD hydrolase-like protein n=1 Tax=unclassified Rhizobium TaxID=2613769 RepID=UPI001AAF5F0F|nr:HAD hydrolase-like protein [Rhizobium sp. T1473]MCA0806219.1 HAD hydrolase-like protein [Rhizobium sp. T1473]
MTAARRAKSPGFILPRLIIFDFDGTLAESEIIASEVISAKLAAHGGHVQPDEITATLSGIERDDQLQHLESSFGLSLPRDFMELVGAEVHSLTSDILIATPGPIELLHWLTIPFCVALKTPRLELIHRMRAAKSFEPDWPALLFF